MNFGALDRFLFSTTDGDLKCKPRDLDHGDHDQLGSTELAWGWRTGLQKTTRVVNLVDFEGGVECPWTTATAVSCFTNQPTNQRMDFGMILDTYPLDSTWFHLNIINGQKPTSTDADFDHLSYARWERQACTLQASRIWSLEETIYKKKHTLQNSWTWAAILNHKKPTKKPCSGWLIAMFQHLSSP